VQRVVAGEQNLQQRYQPAIVTAIGQDTCD
jgi:hypothetical protein